MALPGEKELRALWPALRACSNASDRSRLVDAAITQTANLQLAAHEARQVAIKLLVHGDATNIETKRLVGQWAADYRGDDD